MLLRVTKGCEVLAGYRVSITEQPHPRETRAPELQSANSRARSRRHAHARGASAPGLRRDVMLRSASVSSMPGEKTNETSRFEVKADVSSHFSWLRTRMSMERTLMSWVRTGTALIGFGFTIFQFLHRFNQTPGIKPPEHPWTPWVLGLALIGTGIVAVTIAVWEYRSLVRYLWEKEFKPIAGVDELGHHTPVVAVSVVIILIGIFAFATVLLREP